MNNIYYKDVKKMKRKKSGKILQVRGATKVWILFYSDVELSLLQLIEEEEEEQFIDGIKAIPLCHSLSLWIDLLRSISPIGVHCPMQASFESIQTSFLLMGLKSFYS